jgi:sugar/nucleoside kinase (ribokinase family)
MAKQPHSETKSGPASAGTATAMAAERAPLSPLAGSGVGHDKIARLAYQYWQERGCPDGSPEEDWLRAERELGMLSGRAE